MSGNLRKRDTKPCESMAIKGKNAPGAGNTRLPSLEPVDLLSMSTFKPSAKKRSLRGAAEQSRKARKTASLYDAGGYLDSQTTETQWLDHTIEKNTTVKHDSADAGIPAINCKEEDQSREVIDLRSSPPPMPSNPPTPGPSGSANKEEVLPLDCAVELHGMRGELWRNLTGIDEAVSAIRQNSLSTLCSVLAKVDLLETYVVILKSHLVQNGIPIPEIPK